MSPHTDVFREDEMDRGYDRNNPPHNGPKVPMQEPREKDVKRFSTRDGMRSTLGESRRAGNFHHSFFSDSEWSGR